MNEKTLKVLEFDKIINQLAGFTASQLGREIAESLMPSNDMTVVADRLRETDDGVSFILRRGNPSLGGIRDIRDSLKRVDMGAVLNMGDLLRVADVLRLCRNLKSHAAGDRKVDEENNVIFGFIDCLEANKRIEDKISYSIVSEEEMADDASPTLNSIRRQIRERQESIKEKLNGIIKSPHYQKYMQDPIVTIRAGRYVVPVKQEYRNEVPGLVHDSSASGATMFIEPMAVVEANNSIKQLQIKEQAEIERILAELTEDVAGILPQLKTDMSILAKLDFILAKANLSLKYNGVSPKLNTDGCIMIRKGRHPLLNAETVVPIDFWVGERFTSLIVTGPNTGGKTVTLKTVGLFALMTQAGLNIPAGDNTEICVFNKIFADIGDEQSIEQSLSTFSSHMTNIVKILENADSQSLVLLDELGAGTDPTEGAALAMAILEELHEKRAITVATTHYSELKIYAMTSEHVENASCEFDVETLRPTYRLLIGVPGKSNAFAISKRLGLQEEVLDRARDYLTQEDIRFEDVLLSMEKDRTKAETERVKAEALRLEIEKLKNELEEQKRKISSEKDKIIREAREESKRIITGAKAEAEAVIEEVKRIEKDRQNVHKSRALEEIKQKLRNKVNKIDESLVETIMPRQSYVKPPENLKPGDTVLIVNLGQKGIVIEPPGANGEAIIQAGIMKINVHVTNLKLVDEQKIEIEKVGAGEIGRAKAMNISTEIDLRGFNLDDAIDSVDKYLDDASMTGLKSVTLIHGKGTGILRAGIHRHLRTHPHVQSFRLGKFGEGETGVTVVELKS
ncbi:MAG TPA: endonuclease MutS2 [Clostridiales bacterium]|nr:endonuclease MutS2 [Clostridiales bacterium]